jgi:hypothetical protein
MTTYEDVMAMASELVWDDVPEPTKVELRKVSDDQWLVRVNDDDGKLDSIVGFLE